MNATLINDWWMTTDTGGSMGTTNTSGITSKQQHNAEKIYNYFSLKTSPQTSVNMLI